jgi:hypothetical protein
LFHTHFSDAIIEELSGILTKKNIAELSRFHRIQASPGFHAAIDYLKTQLEKMPGIQMKIETFIADGQTQMWQWTTPMGWRVTDGELFLTYPKRELLARFSETPVCVVAHSRSAELEAPLAFVEEGQKTEHFKGIDVKGKIVLTDGRVRRAHREAVIKRGALGTIHYPSLERRSRYPDLVTYDGIWPIRKEIENLGFAMAVSGKTGTKLRHLIETERDVRVKVKVDAELFEGEQRVLTATIEGKDYPNEELLLIAHLCHPRPGANDNASGSALLIEMARTITTLIDQGRLPQPLRTIRFLWVPEFYGTIAYLHAHPELGNRVLSGINCDMVGEDETQCGGVLKLFRTPDSLPSYVNDLLEFYLEEASKESRLISPSGSRDPLHFQTKRFEWGSDHTMLVDATIGIPCPMVNHFPDDFYHSSGDTVDKCDATKLKRVGFAVIMSTLTQAYAEPHDAMFIATEVHARAQQRLSQTTQQIIHRAIKTINNKSKGPKLTRILRKGIETLRQITHREIKALQSIRVLSRLDENLHTFINSLADNLGKNRAEEIRKLRYVEEILSTSIGYKPMKRLILRKREKVAMELIPHRLFQGPLCFEAILRKVSPEDAEWLRNQQKDKPGFVELLLELTNFTDGHRSTYDILLALEAEFPDLAEITLIERLQKLLEDLKLIEIKKNE